MESLHSKVGGLFEKCLQTAVSGLNYSWNLATIILFGVTLSHMVIGSIPNSTNVISKPISCHDVFLYPLKTSENQRYRKRSVAWNGLIQLLPRFSGHKIMKVEFFQINVTLQMTQLPSDTAEKLEIYLLIWVHISSNSTYIFFRLFAGSIQRKWKKKKKKKNQRL